MPSLAGWRLWAGLAHGLPPRASALRSDVDWFDLTSCVALIRVRTIFITPPQHWQRIAGLGCAGGGLFCRRRWVSCSWVSSLLLGMQVAKVAGAAVAFGCAGMGVGAVNVASSWYSNQKSIAGGDEIMLRNLMGGGYFSAIAASFNIAVKRDALKRAPYLER